MWWRRRKKDKCPEGEAARDRARKDLEEVKGQWEHVHEVQKERVRLTQRNHFGEAIEAIMRKGMG